MLNVFDDLNLKKMLCFKIKHKIMLIRNIYMRLIGYLKKKQTNDFDISSLMK